MNGQPALQIPSADTISIEARRFQSAISLPAGYHVGIRRRPTMVGLGKSPCIVDPSPCLPDNGIQPQPPDHVQIQSLKGRAVPGGSDGRAIRLLGGHSIGIDADVRHSLLARDKKRRS